MIAPFLHRLFPYDRIIMLDLDLKFKVDLDELYEHFKEFSKSNGQRAVMGVANDLSPHYRHVLRYWKVSKLS